MVKPDGTVEPGFTLKWPGLQSACAINDFDQVVVTGGDFTKVNVSVYALGAYQGWKYDLPSLKVGRSNHACTSYVSSDGDQVNHDKISPVPNPSLKSRFQIQVPNSKSKDQRKGNGTGADIIIQQATHPPITFLT